MRRKEKESKRRMGREGGKEGQSERGGWMDGKEEDRNNRDALVRHAMLGWNQVRPTQGLPRTHSQQKGSVQQRTLVQGCKEPFKGTVQRFWSYSVSKYAVLVSFPARTGCRFPAFVPTS